MKTARSAAARVAALLLMTALAGCQSSASSPATVNATIVTPSPASASQTPASTPSLTPTVPSTTPPVATGFGQQPGQQSGGQPGQQGGGQPGQQPGQQAAGRQPLAGVTVVVDPGHNGANAAHAKQINALVDAGGTKKACNTTGTENSTMTEAEFNWQLAGRVQQQLQAAGARVVLTRDSNDGWGPCIDERGKTAQRVGAQYLVSLHADGARPSAHGFHVIHPGQVPGYTDGIVAPSRQLATRLRDALVRHGFSTSTYLGSQGLDERTDLGTLNWARVPTCMLEAGNMANSADAAKLASPAGQDAIATAIVEALIAQHAG